ncbi:hypothetical protein K7X08_017313 [Anisodus acutangulus]|uniref:Uncharacterized protein n=1 Tax=Anisodus acutangulus TaxID=402998 RepID=A0A9Q1LW64_9SOLA|nr:hypothetical protein K7X08_017313 [Anisodus acutangulus]
MSESLYYARREAKNEAVHVDVEDRKVDRLLASPIVFSKKLRSLYNNKQNYADDLEVEWVEEYQPGVFIISQYRQLGIRRSSESSSVAKSSLRRWQRSGGKRTSYSSI